MNYLICALIGYVLGSIPSAYIIVKKFQNKDITRHGSGNAGALNSFEVTGSKLAGVSVLLSDFTKGALTVLLIKYFISDSYLFIATGAISAVFAHCYTPWLKFRGGRGLATAAGSFLFVIPIVALLWMVLWLVAFLLRKDVHTGNIFATLFTPLITFVIPEFVSKINFTTQELNPPFFTISVSVLMMIIFSRHIEPFKVVLRNELYNRRKNETG
ncbi:MAG: glycerol-3-phosphate acyltransferase [Rhodothermaceae bacterium]